MNLAKKILKVDLLKLIKQKTITYMTQSEIEIEYNLKKPLFERTLDNVQQAIAIFLKDAKIPFLNVSGRLKDLESFIEKIERKNYSNPFVDNEDFCGIRIIVYYPDDIVDVQNIIEKEFNLQNYIDKDAELEINEFGYRSKHSIIKIKENWFSTPNYRGLENIKIEIQIRTILMHAWAEIEHKLAYKNKEQIPKILQRQLFRLSAKFEESDEQFQALKEGIEKYRQEITEKFKNEGENIKDIKLNLDSLTALLNYYLSEYPYNQRATSSILTDFIEKKISFSKVEELLKNIKPLAAELNNEVFPNKNLRLTQATILGYARDIFLNYNIDSLYTEARVSIIEKFRQKIN